MLDLTGMKFGRLTVLSSAQFQASKKKMWNCKCECGNYVTVRGTSLIGGITKSCGCLQKELASKKHSKHNGYGTRLYAIWDSMRQRCNNKNCRAYHNYGGRGIKICDEWDDFANFKEWAIISGYDNTAKRGTCTLDRINVNGNYSPENCRWNTMKEQSNNRRNTIYMTVNDETHSLSEWASITGIKYDTLWKRYKKYGWSPERVVS